MVDHDCSWFSLRLLSWHTSIISTIRSLGGIWCLVSSLTYVAVSSPLRLAHRLQWFLTHKYKRFGCSLSLRAALQDSMGIVDGLELALANFLVAVQCPRGRNVSVCVSNFKFTTSFYNPSSTLQCRKVACSKTRAMLRLSTPICIWLSIRIWIQAPVSMWMLA